MCDWWREYDDIISYEWCKITHQQVTCQGEKSKCHYPKLYRPETKEEGGDINERT